MLNFNSVIQGASTGITPMNGIPGGTIADPNTPIAPIIPDPTNPTDVAVYDSQDRLVRYKNHVYSYNANGDLLSKSVEIPDDIDPGTFNLVTTNYVYDIFGNLNQSGNITYQIDPLQRRSAKLVNGIVVKKYIYNPEGQLVGELDAAGNLQKTFIYASKAHVPDYYVDSNNNHFKLIVDQLGSVRLVVNATTGAVVQQMNHDEFGKATMDTSPGLQPFGFAGVLYDSDTKLVRFGLRDFDSEIGRWNSKDVIGFGGGDANLYGYVLQDPANLIDPSGNCPTCIIGAVVGGIVQGGLNAYQGYTGGARTDQIILSSFGGLAIGATTGAIGGATGLLGGTAAASIGAGLNNALNQAIYGNGSFNPSSMGQAALIGGAFGGIGATATASGFSSLLTPQGVGALSGVIGPLAGSSAASGIPNRCSK